MWKLLLVLACAFPMGYVILWTIARIDRGMDRFFERWAQRTAAKKARRVSA